MGDGKEVVAQRGLSVHDLSGGRASPTCAPPTGAETVKEAGGVEEARKERPPSPNNRDSVCGARGITAHSSPSLINTLTFLAHGSFEKDLFTLSANS